LSPRTRGAPPESASPPTSSSVSACPTGLSEMPWGMARWWGLASA
jgi:hypothetical protein